MSKFKKIISQLEILFIFLCFFLLLIGICFLPTGVEYLRDMVGNIWTMIILLIFLYSGSFIFGNFFGFIFWENLNIR